MLAARPHLQAARQQPGSGPGPPRPAQGRSRPPPQPTHPGPSARPRRSRRAEPPPRSAAPRGGSVAGNREDAQPGPGLGRRAWPAGGEQRRQRGRGAMLTPPPRPCCLAGLRLSCDGRGGAGRGAGSASPAARSGSGAGRGAAGSRRPSQARQLPSAVPQAAPLLRPAGTGPAGPGPGLGRLVTGAGGGCLHWERCVRPGRGGCGSVTSRVGFLYEKQLESSKLKAVRWK